MNQKGPLTQILSQLDKRARFQVGITEIATCSKVEVESKMAQQYRPFSAIEHSGLCEEHITKA